MWKLVDVQIIYKKLYQRELVTSDWFFVIRNSSGVQIFRNDEKVRQRHLPKMYTLVVTMNWNRFRKTFRIRFCIFYNRSELSHCTCHQLFSRSCSLFREILLESMEAGQSVTPDSQFLYTGTYCTISKCSNQWATYATPPCVTGS